MDAWTADMGRVIQEHAKRYPAMMPQDVVKLLYQSCFGPRHLHTQPDRSIVTRYLIMERRDLSSRNRNLEDIGNGYVRVYLDAIVDGILDQDRLVDAFVSSMQSDPSCEMESHFQEAMDLVAVMTDQDTMPFSRIDWDTFSKDYLAQGIRPVHHSAIYKERYAPHYRVVARSFLTD